MDVQGNRNELLRSLSPAVAARLDAELQTVSLTAGEVISEPGDDVDYALFPHTGMVSLLAVMRDGSAVETATVGREGAIGAMTGLGPHVTLARAAVQTPLVASRVNAVNFRRLVQDIEELRHLVVRYNEVLLAQVQTTAACNAVHTLEARLSRWILQSRDRIDEDAIPLTHEILSQMLGVRRSSVSEVASKLQAANLISYSRGKIMIQDRAGLERNACECYQTIRERSVGSLKRPP